MDSVPVDAPAIKPDKHRCDGCRETQEKYPDVEGQEAHFAMTWLDRKRMDYDALADMVNGDMGACKRLFPNRDYGNGPKELIADMVTALHHEPASISRHNPRGLVLRHDARLALVLAFAHVLNTVTVAV